MADDDIDVEGEFDMKTELGDEFYDANELPSKSANLLPEFTSPAWMLEQGWSLDSCMDEKSKATIEKMLLEEQQYMNGRKTSRYLNIQKNVLLVTARKGQAVASNKSPWTQEEKNTFLRGMGIFGRSWSKIASLIPTRTSLQVKNYAQQYMKTLAKRKAEQERNELETLKSMSETPLFTPQPSLSLETSLAAVTTAQPTVTTPSIPSTAASHLPKASVAAASIKTKQPERKRNPSPSKKPAVKNQGPKKQIETAKKKVPHQKHRKKMSPKANSFSFLNSHPVISDGKEEINLVINENSKSRESSNHSTVSDSGISSLSVTRVKGEEEDEDIEVDVDIVDDDDPPFTLSCPSSPSSVYKQLLKSAEPELAEVTTNGSESSVQEEDQSQSEGEEVKEEPCEDLTSSQECTSTDILDTDGQASCSHSKDDSNDGTKDSDMGDHTVKTETIVNGLIGANREIIEFEIPESEKELDPCVITEEEKTTHSDFFDGRPPKTPERYLKIRNYIVDCWLKVKPAYLNKTSIRSGLKNCGDVNCIGRIHSYLECIGAINFGCEQAAYRHPHRVMGGGINSRVKVMNRELISSYPITKPESTRPRKKRKRDGSGLWVDEKELEGKTIEHESEKKKSESGGKSKGARTPKTVYDPFKLVPCLFFTEEYQAPYKIEMFNTALATMDIHAHISKTEVIGMLGGQYYSQAKCLVISMAVPCKSMSTGMQCEMDPVSQTLASEQIEDVGMSVVGWYHSHPTFGPDPSVRDIETQKKFQYWFSKGGSHFVGVIISPYNSLNTSMCSTIRCLTVSDQHSKEFHCNLPYKFDYQVVYRDNLREILGPASELAEKYSKYVNRVLLNCQYKPALGITCLSKMLQSVKHLLLPPDDKITEPSCTQTTTADTISNSSSQPTSKPSSSQPSTSGTNDNDTASSSSTSELQQSCLGTSGFTSPILSFPSSAHSKVEEVMHWLEQIFLEKFSGPSSPTSSSSISTTVQSSSSALPFGDSSP